MRPLPTHEAEKSNENAYASCYFILKKIIERIAYVRYLKSAIIRAVRINDF